MITRAELERYRRMTDHHRRSPEAKAFRRKLEAAIKTLPRDLQRIVVFRYCLRLSWTTVAMKIPCGERTVFRLDKKACKALEERE